LIINVVKTDGSVTNSHRSGNHSCHLSLGSLKSTIWTRKWAGLAFSFSYSISA